VSCSDASSRTARPRPHAPRAPASMPTAEGRGSARTTTASSRRRTLSRRPTAPSTRALSMPTSATLGRSSNARRSTPRARGRTRSRLAGNAASSPPSVASPRSTACRTTRELTPAASRILEQCTACASRQAAPAIRVHVHQAMWASPVARIPAEGPSGPSHRTRAYRRRGEHRGARCMVRAR
jgi:hypothetical protein